MAVSAHRKYEDELLAKGAISGLVAFPGGFIVGVLINPFLGLAMFIGSGWIFLETINTPNPHDNPA